MNSILRRKMKYILLLVMFSSISTAQNNQLRMRIKVSSLDDKRQIVLHSNGELEEFYDGYIVFPNLMDRIQGGIKEGGFSFLDYTGMDTYFETKKQREKLAKKKYPSGDLEVFSNGFDADKVLSFRIIPEFVNEKDDTVSLFIKYVLYDFDNEQVDLFNWDSKINLYNKLLRVPLNEEISIHFFDDKLRDYKLSVFLSRVEFQNDFLKIKNKKIFEGIKDAVGSCNKLDEKLKFDMNFGKSNKLSDEPYFLFSVAGESQSSINIMDVESFNSVEFNSERVDLSSNIYHTKISTPFTLQNKEKAKKYEAYSSIEKIFISTYDIFFLPLSIEGDSLIGKLFISIEKLHLNDGIERWSLINKIVIMKINTRNRNSISSNRYWSSLIFKLPKENWSAFFTRSGEEYEIYGYSDYERFITEYLNIAISKSEVE